MYNTQWNSISIFFYVLLALIGMCCMHRIKKDSGFSNFKRLFANPFFLLWWGIWTIAAAYRLVGYGIGGTDASGYIDFFQNCLRPNYLDDHSTGDFLFLYITKFFRCMSEDYHVYFIFMYGFMLAVYIYFLKFFTESKYSVVPYFLTFYLFLRSFNTLRSNFAIAVILLSLVAFSRKEYRKAYIIAIGSVLIHKAAFIYAAVLPFVHIFRKRRINYYNLIIFAVLSTIVARIFQQWFIGFADNVELGGAYKAYASRSLEEDHSFLYVDSLGQWLLAFLLWKFRKVFIFESQNNPKMQLLWLASVFDIMMVPFSSILGIWRAYEFLYLVRLSMLSFLIWYVLRNKNRGVRYIVQFGTLVFFISWMVYRISRTYEDSALLPYVFEPFMNI